MKTGESSVPSVVFSPDGRALISATDDGVKVWHSQTGSLLKTLRRNEGEREEVVKAVASSPVGQAVAAGYADGTVALWNVQAGPVNWRTRGHESGVTSVGFSADGKTVASGGMDKNVKVRDAAAGQPLLVLSQGGFVNTVAFTPRAHALASGGYSKAVRLWALR